MDIGMLWTQVIMVLISALLGGGLLWLFFWKYKKAGMIWELARKKVENEQSALEQLEKRINELGNLLNNERRSSLEFRDELDQIKVRLRQSRRDQKVLFDSCSCNDTEEIREIRARYEAAEQEDQRIDGNS